MARIPAIVMLYRNKRHFTAARLTIGAEKQSVYEFS
jgi:hypothetical protein